MKFLFFLILVRCMFYRGFATITAADDNAKGAIRGYYGLRIQAV